MKTNYLFPKISYKVFSLLTVLTLLLSGFAFGGVQRASAEGAPYIMVNPSGHWAIAYNWPPGVDVTLTVRDYSATLTFSTQAYFHLTNLDLVPGDIVTVTGDNITKVLEITNFAVTGLNVAENTLSGTASPGASVWTCADNAPGGCRFAKAGSDGIWIMESVDPAAFVLAPGVLGWGAEPDPDGDLTRMDWIVPAPYVGVNPVWNTISGQGMPIGTELTVTIIEDGVDIFTSQPTPIMQNPNDPNDISANFDLQGTDVKEGQVLVTSGGGVSSTYTVTDFAITNIDPLVDTVSGSATPGSVMQICVNLPDRCALRYPTADSNGNWVAYFGVPGMGEGEEDIADIQPGSNGWGNEHDSEWRNQTWSAWNLPIPPHIEAFAWFDRYSLADWPGGQTVLITIDDPTTSRMDYETNFIPDASNSWYDLYPGIDLQPGMVITAENGEFTKELVISNLSASVNAVTGMVTGVAAPGRTFHMKTDGDHFNNPIEQDIIADSSGNWSANFSALAPLVWFTGGEMWEGDTDGDVTYAKWHVHNELVEVWLAQNELRAYDWPRDKMLKFTVLDLKGEMHEYFGSTQPLFWMEGTQAAVNPDDLQLKPGMTVTVSDGIVKTSTVIRDVKITSLDPNHDVVYGFAPSNAHLELISNKDSPVIRYFDADDDGSWMVDYKVKSVNGVTVDLTPGDVLQLFLREDDKDSTVWESTVTNPRFDVRANVDQVEAWEWTAGETLTLKVNGKIVATQEVGQCPWDPNYTYALFNLAGLVNIQVGDDVILTNGPITKTTVVTPLEFTDIDVENDRVTGIATPNARVDIWACPPNANCFNRLVDADGDGSWVADFAHIGDEGGEQDIVDIIGGTWIDSRQVDEDSDGTMYGVTVPNPRFDVRANVDQVEAWEWAEGDTLTLWVNDEEIASLEVTPAPWDPAITYVSFNLSGLVDIQLDDLVSLTNSEITKETVVSTLEFTDIDVENNTVTGIATPNARVDIWACPPSADCFNRHVDADGEGNWVADFAHIGDEGDEQDIVDIISGTWIDSRQWDEDSDSTMYSVTVPNPRLIAFPENEAVEGWEWPDGASVHLSIDDPTTPTSPDFERDGVMAVTTWGDPRTYIRFDFAGEYNLKVGDLVTLTDGVTPRQHTVMDLAVTATDMVKDTVAGTAYVGATVQVWPHGYDQIATVQVPAADGTWQADFTGLFDLVGGTGGRSQILDEVGNATAVDWTLPNPRFDVRANVDQVEAWEWTVGEMLTLTVGGQHFKSIVEVPEWDPSATYASFNLSAVRDIQLGDELTLSNGTITKTTVVTNHAITGVDLENEIVHGIATPNNTVYIWACDDLGCYNRHALVDGSGSWEADFSVPGDPTAGNENNTVDLVYGIWIDSIEYDADSDSTMFGMTVPTPDAIYIFDPRTGVSKPVTNLPTMGAYNPSWSPDGKKIVHDAWNGSFDDVYVTNVAKGTSTALRGAKGGNDAVWSPNGQWIAFDRRWVGDPNLYYVPAAGGVRKLLRANAVSASWAPNSLRLAFQDLADGGKLKTISFSGASVTVVAEYGENPDWSPNGQWITFERDGDIWKVQVNLQGKALGQPIQVTSAPGIEGQPTWSADSRWIVFHGGSGDDLDLWKVSASGGAPQRLVGAAGFGDYDPAYARDGRIAYSSFAFPATVSSAAVSSTTDARVSSENGQVETARFRPEAAARLHSQAVQAAQPHRQTLQSASWQPYRPDSDR